MLTAYIQNVWAGEPQERDDAVIIRCHCFSSLKAKKCMLCIWLLRNQVMFFQLHAHALQKKVRHAVTLQLSCSTWKTSRDKTTAICPLTLLLLSTCSNSMPPPLSVIFSAQPVEGITFRKVEYGRVVCASFGHHYCPYPSDAKSNHDHAQAQQLIPSFVRDDWGDDHWFCSQ